MCCIVIDTYVLLVLFFDVLSNIHLVIMTCGSRIVTNSILNRFINTRDSDSEPNCHVKEVSSRHLWVSEGSKAGVSVSLSETHPEFI